MRGVVVVSVPCQACCSSLQLTLAITWPQGASAATGGSDGGGSGVSRC